MRNEPVAHRYRAGAGFAAGRIARDGPALSSRSLSGRVFASLAHETFRLVDVRSFPPPGPLVAARALWGSDYRWR
jgi:hypothetical protein